MSIEFARWRQEPILEEISRKHMRQAAATLSLLAPSQDEDAVDDVLSRLPEWSQEHLLRSRFAELLVQSLLRDDGAEAVSLRPDPVAEHSSWRYSERSWTCWIGCFHRIRRRYLA